MKWTASPASPLELLILRILSRQGPIPEPALATAVRLGSDGKFPVREETLSPVLESLAVRGQVRAHWASPQTGRRRYVITPLGRQRVAKIDRQRRSEFHLLVFG